MIKDFQGFRRILMSYKRLKNFKRFGKIPADLKDLN